MDDIEELEGADSYRSLDRNRDARGRYVIDETETDRFDRFVNRSTDPAGCHLWTGPRNAGGYPRFRTIRTWVLAHRYAWKRAGLELSDNETLDHLIGPGEPCTSILCVRPDHLEPVTNSENLRRRHARRRALDGAQL